MATTDNRRSDRPGSAAHGWLARLADGRWVLAAAALALLACMLAGQMTPAQAAVAFVLVLAAALLVPRRPTESGPATQDNSAGQEARRAAVTGFADALREPCVLLDARAIVMHRNESAASQFPNLTVGRPLSFSLRDPLVVSAIDRVSRTGLAESVELYQTVPNRVWFKVDVARLPFHGSGETGWVVLTMFNLTEQRRVEAMRADFVANASHELRTPLASLSGFIETLQGPAANDEAARERFLGIMQGQAARMSNLIDDLLSLSRIELRQHVKPSGSVTLSALLQEVVDGLQTQAGEAGVKVKVGAPPEPVVVPGDRSELYEVFENLVDNAIKYGGDGGTVEVELQPAAQPGYAWTVTVTDHGAGIAQEHVPRLTERFYRVDADSSRRKKGTGLGLAIVKHILARHGGLMTIRSEPGKGTSVQVLLTG